MFDIGLTGSTRDDQQQGLFFGSFRFASPVDSLCCCRYPVEVSKSFAERVQDWTMTAGLENDCSQKSESLSQYAHICPP